MTGTALEAADDQDHARVDWGSSSGDVAISVVTAAEHRFSRHRDSRIRTRGRSVEPVIRKQPHELEVPLLGGDLTEGLMRVGETVRRPRIAESDLVEALLLHLQRCGFDGAPRFLGIDEAGRQVLSFVHGEVAGRPWPDWVADDQRILSVARQVRRYDDAAQGFGLLPVPAAAVDPGPAGMPASTMGPATFVGHMDITPENVVFRDGQAWALIDFDLARPTNRLREVCNMCCGGRR